VQKDRRIQVSRMLSQDEHWGSRSLRDCHTCCSSHQETEGQEVLDLVILQVQSAFVFTMAMVPLYSRISLRDRTVTESAGLIEANHTLPTCSGALLNWVCGGIVQTRAHLLAATCFSSCLTQQAKVELAYRGRDAKSTPDQPHTHMSWMALSLHGFVFRRRTFSWS
jgi:hypothetical protein